MTKIGIDTLTFLYADYIKTKNMCITIIMKFTRNFTKKMHIVIHIIVTELQWSVMSLVTHSDSPHNTRKEMSKRFLKRSSHPEPPTKSIYPCFRYIKFDISEFI